MRAGAQPEGSAMEAEFGAGFVVADRIGLRDLPAPDQGRMDRMDRVDAAIEAAHGDSPRFAQAQEQERRSTRHAVAR
jgi:hypothetical protein